MKHANRLALFLAAVLRYDHGRFSLRFPMVVGPRFIRVSSPARCAR